MELIGLQKEIWKNRYAFPDEKNWEDTSKRVARVVASAENDIDMQKWQDRFFDIVNSGYFIPGGRILKNAGRKRQSLINCFISELIDDGNSIGDFLKTTYMVGIHEGGFGYIADIRPLGAPIAGTNFAAPGVISTVKCIDAVGNHTRAGGGRRGAIWCGVRVAHPDCFYWIDAKKDKKVLNNHNISVIINNDFINAVKNNKDWTFVWNNKPWYIYTMQKRHIDGKNKIIKVVAPDKEYAKGIAETFFKDDYRDIFENIEKDTFKARDFWNKIIQNASHDSGGEPGLINESLIQENFTAGYYTNWIGLNGCTEVTAGGPHDVCCLGHLNLSAMYDETTNDIDYSKMQEVIHIAVRFLDNVLTINDYPLPEIKSSALRGRRIGLGFTGFAHLLIKMGIRYGSDKCLNFIDRFMTTFRNESYKASINLAKERGAFLAFNSEQHLQNSYIKKLPASIQRGIAKYGLRNVAVNLLAPCGTISLVLNTSSSLEPIFAPIYKRRYRKGEVLYEDIVVDPLFEKYLKNNEIPNYFVGAYDISIEDHLRVLSTAQNYLCQSISKTSNISKDFRDDQLADLILQYIPFIKGLTLYKEGSRSDEPLEPIKIESDKFKKIISEKYNIGVESQECLTGVCEI